MRLVSRLLTERHELNRSRCFNLTMKWQKEYWELITYFISLCPLKTISWRNIN